MATKIPWIKLYLADEINERCGGIDIGKRFLFCCALTGAAHEEPRSQTMRFDVTVLGLTRPEPSNRIAVLSPPSRCVTWRTIATCQRAWLSMMGRSVGSARR